MIPKLSLFALICIASAGSITLLAQDTEDSPSVVAKHTVEAAFPPALRYAKPPDKGAETDSNDYNTCSAVFNQSANGTPDLIAAAYSGKGVEVAMLSYRAGAVRIVDAVQDNWPHHTDKIHQFDFAGGPCDASIVNLSDPAQPDSLLAKTVEISFNGQDWYFLWDGKKLRNITALQSEGAMSRNGIPPDSHMHTSRVVDLDHHGAMQIIGNNGDFDHFPKDDGISATGTTLLFRYNGTAYEEAKTFLALDEYEPKPANWNEDRDGPWSGTYSYINRHQEPAPSYTLRIVNGDRDGSNRVSSAKIEINGATIVSPIEVNQGVEMLSRTIQIQKENEIRVTVDGPQKSHIYVVVE